MNIYFVEDDPKVFEAVESTITEHLGQMDIQRCDTQKLQAGRFIPEPESLVLFDLDCQDPNVIEIFSALFNKTKAPIIVLDDIRTGLTRLKKAVQLGASDYLFKPIIKSHLISIVVVHSNTRLKLRLSGG